MKSGEIVVYFTRPFACEQLDVRIREYIMKKLQFLGNSLTDKFRHQISTIFDGYPCRWESYPLQRVANGAQGDLF